MYLTFDHGYLFNSQKFLGISKINFTFDVVCSALWPQNIPLEFVLSAQIYEVLNMKL